MTKPLGAAPYWSDEETVGGIPRAEGSCREKGAAIGGEESRSEEIYLGIEAGRGEAIG